MTSGPIHLHIADVLTAVPANIGVEAGMVVLTEDEMPYRSLRIIIGPTEAGAISAGWHGAVPGRPSTWDLFMSTVALLDGRVDRVVITGVQEERHYFAHIELEQAGERRILACRPSDALALAVRGYQVDILAEAAVLEAAGVMPDGSKYVPEPMDPPTDAEAQWAEREAALAAREAELAERERALSAQLAATAPDEITADPTADAPTPAAEPTPTPTPGTDVPPADGPASASAPLPPATE